MELRVKFLNWSAGIPVVMVHKKTADALGVPLKGRIELTKKTGTTAPFLAIMNTSDEIINQNEIGVSQEVREAISLKKNERVDIGIAEPPHSLTFIKKKLEKKSLSEKEIEVIIEDVVKNALSDPEIALFVSAMAQRGMSMKETVFLIKAILKTGNTLSFKGKIVGDKHSIGGIAGRTTPLVVSICAAAGLCVPKTSSRAITSAAGTADIMETVADVDLPLSEIQRVIKKTNACIVWGGGLGLVPADSKIITIEKALTVDPEAQLLASIMAKKLAVGSNFIVIDIPYGKTSKVDRKKALVLKKKFEALGKHFHKDVECALAHNTGPLGNGVGPVLELLDVLKVLRRESPCHKLEERSLELAGCLLELAKKAIPGKGKELAKKMLDTKEAYKKFQQIIRAQHGNLSRIVLARYKKNIFAKRSMSIKEIDNKKINALARAAGSPQYKAAGLYLHVHEGSRANKGDCVLTIYAESPARLQQAVRFYQRNNPFIVAKHN